MPTVRNKRIHKGLDIKNGVGLEIGPLTAPVVAKNEAKEVYYLDHMSQQDLRKKYKDEPIDPDQIQPVDFILKDNSLHKSVRGKKFDYVIASHVIEHIPDMVSWLKDVQSILKPGGILALVIPDKRFTFDIERSITEPSEVIGAYLERLQKPSSAAMYDFASHYAESIDTASVWNDEKYYLKLLPKHRWTRQESIEMCLRSLKPRQYVDSHCYVFTPSSFLDILRELTALDFVDLEVSSFLETQSYELEFFVSLRNSRASVSQKQLLGKIPKIHEKNQEEELLERVATLESEQAALTNSLSWRITKPLRSINNIKRQFTKR